MLVGPNGVEGPPAHFQATVKVVEYLGSEALLYFDLGDQTYTGRVDPHMTVLPDRALDFHFGFRRAAFFDPRTEERLA